MRMRTTARGCYEALSLMAASAASSPFSITFTAVIVCVLNLHMQTVSAQIPLLSPLYDGIISTCDFEDLLHQLGSTNQLDNSGIVALNLYEEAMRLERGSKFFPLDLPFVHILSAKVTCQSSYGIPMRGNQTFAVLVDYLCRGVACHQQPSEVRPVQYLHLFSFPCRRGGVGLYSLTFLTYMSFLPAYIDRTPSNTIENTEVSPPGSCMLCRVLPSSIQPPGYNPVTACHRESLHM